VLPHRFDTRYQTQTTNLPFPASVRNVTILVDYQNVLINSAKAGAPISVSLLARALSRRYAFTRFHLFTSHNMLPGNINPPQGVYVRYEVQYGAKNCDIGLTIFAMKNMLSWYKRGDAIIFCTGDGGFCEVADVLRRFGRGINVAFLSLPGSSTSKTILHSRYEVGIIGEDILEGKQLRVVT